MINNSTSFLSLILCVMLLLCSCANEQKSKITLQETKSAQDKSIDPKVRKTKFEQPELQQFTLSKPFPSKEDWQLEQKISVDDFDPVGIAVFGNMIVLTDTSQSKVIALDQLNGNELTVISSTIKSAYISNAGGRIALPLYDLDSLIFYRWEPNYFSVNLEVDINKPTCFTGFNLNNYFVVNQGESQVLNITNQGHNIIGQPGQFKHPSSILFSNKKLHVVDSGNKMIHLFNDQARHLGSYGKNENLIWPTGIANDPSNIFIADAQANCIALYNQNGQFLYKIEEGIDQPSDVSFFGGKLFVANKQGDAVSILSNPFYSDRNK